MERSGLMRMSLIFGMLILLAPSHSRAQDLIVNGSFESFSLSGPPNDTTYPQSPGVIRIFGPPSTTVNTEIAGWTIFGQRVAVPNNVDLVDNSLYPAFAGS